jgi:hypothetical protein
MRRQVGSCKGLDDFAFHLLARAWGGILAFCAATISGHDNAIEAHGKGT